MIQLNPPIPLSTPKGHGLAHFLIDYGMESDLYWTVFQTDTGEIWTWNNKEVRADKNISLGRKHVTPFYNPDDMAFKKPTLDRMICVGCGFSQILSSEEVLDWICPKC